MVKRIKVVIDEWKEKGVIELADPDCPWNWPLLVAQRKIVKDFGTMFEFVWIIDCSDSRIDR